MIWTAERVAKVVKLSETKKYSEIAAMMGTTKNAVAGAVYRSEYRKPHICEKCAEEIK